MHKIRLKILIGYLIIAMLLVISGCSETELEVVATGTDEVRTEQQDTTFTEAELWDILQEEIRTIQNNNGRIVDVTGMEVVKDNPKKVYVHYMPWFQSLEYDGWWGQHWTMTNQNPDKTDESGKRQIASYYYPIIGPYSSKDPQLQQYHFMMMKLSGVDGVIFDWYGSRNLYDYQLLKEATETFMETLEELELDFTIMYEDRVAEQAFNEGLSSSVITAAQEDMLYMENQYFSSDRYIKWGDQYSLMVFGPHHITTPGEWDQIFDAFSPDTEVSFLTLWAAQNRVGESASGEFLWIAPDHLAAHEHYYSVYPQYNSITVGSVYPGFESFYSGGGWSDGVNDWVLDHDDGNTFVETLNYTHHEVADFIQIATWNDFGEGTMIEPTEEFGFMYLQLLQQYTGVHHTPEDLQVALDLYNTRKKYANNERVQKLLDQSYEYMKDLKMRRVKAIIRAINLYL